MIFLAWSAEAFGECVEIFLKLGPILALKSQIQLIDVGVEEIHLGIHPDPPHFFSSPYRTPVIRICSHLNRGEYADDDWFPRE